MRMTRRRLLPFLVAVQLLLTVSPWMVLRFWPLPEELLDPPPRSLQILDRHGLLLRDVPQADVHQWRVSLSEVSPWFLEAVVLSEDRRFRAHPGVDPLAVVRAAWQDALAGRVVSGGSTITQQYVRSVVPVERSLRGKIVEAILALALERRLSKDEILQRYVNHLPFGHRMVGIQAAARGYFGKDAAMLNPAEAALLAVIPRAPTWLDPLRRVQRAWDLAIPLLRKMREQGLLDDRAFEAATAGPPEVLKPDPPFLAPHATTSILAAAPGPGVLRTTLDAEIQERAATALRTHLALLGRPDVTNGAVVVADSRTGEILALVGSADFFDAPAAGQVNGAESCRQPGSTLKPFLYALAFASGRTPATLIPDIPTQFDIDGQAWSPRNHDRRFRGPVRMREALASSLNVPAARLLSELGTGRFLSLLRNLGFLELDRSPSWYGLGLVLGDAPVRLTSLVEAYATLARGGEHRPLRLVLDEDSGNREASRVFSEEVAFLVSDILSDRWARAQTFGLDGVMNLPFRAAVKTGTSTDHRDSWAVGYTPDYTVGVWIGNMSGRVMGDLWAAEGAAPVCREILVSLHAGRDPGWYPEPAGMRHIEVCPISGGIPGPACPGNVPEILPPGAPLPGPCAMHVEAAIDIRNGLLAGPGCDPRFVVTRPVLRLGAEYRPWVDRIALAVEPDRHSPLCPAAHPEARTGGALHIVRPVDGETYRIDLDVPERARTLQLLVAGNDDGTEVRWVVDDRPGPVCVVNQPCRWKAVAGEHVFRVEGVPGRVRITVR